MTLSKNAVTGISQAIPEISAEVSLDLYRHIQSYTTMLLIPCHVGQLFTQRLPEARL